MGKKGYEKARIAVDAVIFTINNIPIKVAKLSKLLYSKKVAGRKKDRIFLKRYEELLGE